MSTTELLDWQRLALGIRGRAWGILHGNRGGGKTYCLVLLAIAHALEYKDKAKILILRETLKSQQELAELMFSLLLLSFDGKIQRNKTDGTFTTPDGAVIQLAHIQDEEAFRSLQGRNWTFVGADEAGSYPPNTNRFLHLAISGLRPPPGVIDEVYLLANPGGRNHTYFVRNHISKAPNLRPYLDDHGNTWINIPSDFRANKFIDAAKYERTLALATAGNDGLRRSWTAFPPEWNAMSGGSLLNNFRHDVHVVEPPDRLPPGRVLLGIDYGSASPSVAVLGVELYEHWRLGQQVLMPGDVLCVEECDTVLDRSNLSVGTGVSVSIFGDAVMKMCRRWGVNAPEAVVDNARGLHGEDDTVVGLLNEAGMWASAVVKRTRSAGWDLMRQMLQNAVDDERGGLYFTTRCPYLIQTIPELPRHPTNSEEVANDYKDDHAADAARYLVEELKIHRGGGSQGKVVGWY